MPILPLLLALAAGVPHLSATRIDKPPVLDGRLDDAVWRSAKASDAFTQKLPEGGKPPGEPTVVRVPGATHWIVHERPAFVAAEIERALAR